MSDHPKPTRGDQEPDNVSRRDNAEPVPPQRIISGEDYDEYDRADFMRDLKRVAKRSSEDDASRENAERETPGKSDRRES